VAAYGRRGGWLKWWPEDPTLAKAYIPVIMFRSGQIFDSLSPRITRVLVE
jgi:hypothetical protein